MVVLLAALGLIVLSGVVALLAGRHGAVARWTGSGGVVVGSLVGLVPVLWTLLTGGRESLHLVWGVPYGSFFVELDALSSVFLIPILGLSALAAIYGGEYLEAYAGRKSAGPPWFFFNLLVAAMAMVTLARNGVLFLVCWEMMALSSFFLVTFEDEHERVREAGWTYLVATHLGTAFLMAMFILLGRESGSLDFDQFRVAPGLGGVLFALAVVGFGTKAGFMPFHVWLPEAHPAAPSFVSAVMSGVMIKTGIYGLMRTVTFLGTPSAWWGWLLILLGLLSGVLGVLFALAQSDLKRLLAYSSVENIGIIGLGLGIGLLGQHYGSAPVAVLGFAGALLHLLNHATFKGLLFLAAGSVMHATGTRNMEKLGGLLKSMPWTGLLFLTGAVAISGLPVLNGFAGEYLIYLGALEGQAGLEPQAAVPLLLVIGGLATIGGLAAATFTKAFGISFLGSPRSTHVEHAHEPGKSMRLPMGVLAACCWLIGLTAPWIVGRLTPALEPLTGLPAGVIQVTVSGVAGSMMRVVAATVGFLLVLGGLVLLRRWLLRGREVTEAGTWDCGYAAPTVRIQYTGSSFSQPLTDFFRSFVRTRRRFVLPRGVLPSRAALSTQTPDVWREVIYRPLFRVVGLSLGRLRFLQQGRVQVYVLYIAVTLVALLVWNLG